MSKSFIGCGFNFPLKTDAAGATSVSRDEENIEQSIKIILGTAKGERLYRATFGCGIHDLVFQPNNMVTAAQVASAVKDALIRFEPRIMDVKVTAEPDEFENNRLNVSISYVVRALNKRENMVYPFYLRREEEV
ncbi:MAG: GPW/gp25 family protein [Myxococcota bacterium]|nr:GPW/gp25 family protein [Myxococcota bacterium]